MRLKISLLKCIFLLSLSTIHCFNVIMMKNLNESQLVNKLTEIANEGKHNDMVRSNSISVRKHSERNPRATSSEEDDTEDQNIKTNDIVEESDEGDENVPKINNTIKKHLKNKHKDARNPENSSKTMDMKPIERTKKHKKSTHTRTSTPKLIDESTEMPKPNFGSAIKTIWNTLRTWFRRNGVSGLKNKKIRSLIDDQNLIEVMKRIIIIMRASENSGKMKTDKLEQLNPYVLRNERSGEENDPLSPGKLPMNLINLFTSTEPPKTMWYKPNSFWNYWTYPKEVYTDNCKGEGLIQNGNLCMDSLG